MYSEDLFKKVIVRESIGIILNDERISTIRYEDDIVLSVESKHELQTMLNAISQCSSEYGFEINTKKIIVVTRNPNIPNKSTNIYTTIKMYCTSAI